MSRWARGLAIAGCCAYPLLNHAAVVLDEPRWAALGITLVVCVLASGLRRVLFAALLVVFTLALALWVADHLPGLLLYVPPVAFNLAMCVFFALTLRRGHEPLVTRFARIGRSGQLAPDLARYTRNLTRAWAGFFVLMAAISTLLAVTGPVAAWSLFSNIFNYLLVVLFFIVEYVYRRVRYRHHSHISPWEMIRRLRNYKLVTRSHTEA